MSGTQIAPQGGVSNSQTAPNGGVSNSQPPAAATGSQSGDKDTNALFNAGYSKASEKLGAELQAAREAAAKAQSELDAIRRNGLDAEGLKKLAAEKEEAAKRITDQHLSFRSQTASYFQSEIDALPDDYKVIMKAVDIGDFGRFTETLAQCKKLAGQTKAPPQGGAVQATGAPVGGLLKEYQEAKEKGDMVKLNSLLGNPKARKAIEDALLLQQRR